MTNAEAFSYLGIPMTKNLSEINKRYQTLVTCHHPEEDPEGFMRLHGAYKTACAYAKGTGQGSTGFTAVAQKAQEEKPFREENPFESLFSDMETKPAADITSAKNTFSRKLSWLKWHWLPIGLKRWQHLFGSEAYLLCRESPECMEALLELLERKVHAYPVVRFLLAQLWELYSWQKSEHMEQQATRTQACIKTLHAQYGHYLKGDTQPKAIRLLKRPFWYYQAVPFYFKLLVTGAVMPLLSDVQDETRVWLILGFYFLELCTCIRKSRRELGIFHPIQQKGKQAGCKTKPGDNPFVELATVFAIFFHIALCIGI